MVSLGPASRDKTELESSSDNLLASTHPVKCTANQGSYAIVHVMMSGLDTLTTGQFWFNSLCDLVLQGTQLWCTVIIVYG